MLHFSKLASQCGNQFEKRNTWPIMFARRTLEQLAIRYSVGRQPCSQAGGYTVVLVTQPHPPVPNSDTASTSRICSATTCTVVIAQHSTAQPKPSHIHVMQIVNITIMCDIRTLPSVLNPYTAKSWAPFENSQIASPVPCSQLR